MELVGRERRLCLAAVGASADSRQECERAAAAADLSSTKVGMLASAAVWRGLLVDALRSPPPNAILRTEEPTAA
jgi:hypothetical protein